MRYVASLDALERATVAGLMEQVRDLLEAAPTPSPAGGDEFDRIVAGIGGMGVGVSLASEDQVSFPRADVVGDPALARLLPMANRTDDQVAAEFRRLTEAGLRQRKSAALSSAIGALTDGDKVVLDDASAMGFVSALTDVRLVLAERMDLRDEADVEALETRLAPGSEDDPLAYAAAVYDFLTWLQESLSSALLDRGSPA